MNSALAHETHQGGLVDRLNLGAESKLLDFPYQRGILIPDFNPRISIPEVGRLFGLPNNFNNLPQPL
jgi:hypothetical protein